MNEIENQKQLSSAWFKSLRDEICSILEEIEMNGFTTGIVRSKFIFITYKYHPLQPGKLLLIYYSG